MKVRKPLLFFCLIIINTVSVFNTYLLPQTIKNSTTYYASIANNPELSLSLANAYKFFNKKKDECLKKHDTINAINHLRQLAIIQNELGDYLGCETNIVHALKLLNQLKETEITNESKVGLYNQIGRLNLILLKYETSLDYFKKGLKIAKHPRHINILQNNMALVYIKQLNFELAEKILAEIYEKSKTQVGAEQTTARALDNLGNVQAKLGRPVALDNLKKALKMRLEIKDNYGLYSSYSHLKEFYSDKKDVNKAVFYANQAYDVAKTVNSISYIEDALSNIISLSSDPNVLKYKQLKDSITNARQIADNKYALIKYDYLKKENEAKVDGTDYENH